MRIIMDDAGDVPAEFIAKYNIHVMPINVMFGTEEFLSGVTMNHKEFYAKVKTVTDANFPKTSQPTPHQFVEAYEKMIAEGETEFITITISEKLSGTYASAVMAHRELAGKATFHLVDSQSGAGAFGFQVMEAAKMAAEGASAAQILARIDEVKKKTTTIFMIDNLEYAVRGGRVSAWRSTVASLLKIKPIMKLEDGRVVEDSKVRSHKKAISYLVEYAKQRVGNKPVRAFVEYGGDASYGEALRIEAQEGLNIQELYFMDLCLPVAINMGPGALALIVMEI
jgi:DegV family protein with EDD domain